MTKSNFLKNNAIEFFVYAFCALSLILIAFRNTISFDVFWHLAIGRDILEHGWHYALNLKDEYSYALLGQTYTSSILFDYSIALVVSFLGVESGFFTIKLLTSLCFLGCIYWLFRNSRVSWPIALFTLPLIVYFFQFRATMRPELVSHILIVVSLILYQQADKYNFTIKSMLPIALLLLFWVNYHSPLFGYIIFFGLFVDKAINKLKGSTDYTWAQWLFWGGIIFFIGFINPEFEHFVFSALTFDSRWNNFITEWKPVWMIYGNLPQIWLLYLLNLYLILFLLYKRQYGYLIITSLLTFYSWNMVRLITPAAIINLSILSIVSGQIEWSAHLKNLRKNLQYLIIGIWLFIILFSYYSLIEFAQTLLIRQNKTFEHNYPYEIIEYLKEKNKSGAIFNQYRYGGFINYYLGQDYPVTIDGRTEILYSFDYFQHYQKLQSSPSVLAEEIKQYNIEYALYGNAPDAFNLLNKTRKMSVDFLSDHFLLMSSHNPAFPISGALMFRPACWQRGMTQQMTHEINHKNILPEGSSLHKFLQLIEHNDKKYINALKITEQNPIQYLRAAAYITAEHKLWKKSAEFFSNIPPDEKRIRDWFMMAYFLAKAGYYDDAEKILNFSAYSKWTTKEVLITGIDKSLFLYILQLVEKNISLKIYNSDYLKRLQQEVKNEGFPISTKNIPEYLCKGYDRK